MTFTEVKSHFTGDTEDFLQAEFLILGWLMGNPGWRFSLSSLAEELEVSEYYVAKAIGRSPCHELVGYDEELTLMKFFSRAVEEPPTFEGIREEINISTRQRDKLGREARAEFFRRMHEPNLVKKKRHKVLRVF